MEKNPKLNIFIENTYRSYDTDEIAVHKDILKMAEFIFGNNNIISKSCISNREYNTISFDVVLADNAEIHRINKEYRKKDSPTDVITFAIFADSAEDEKFILDGEINLGEIIVSLDKIEEQSKENHVTFNDELYYLVSHGILHLLGFDHQNEHDYNFMVENQNKAKAVIL